MPTPTATPEPTPPPTPQPTPVPTEPPKVVKPPPAQDTSREAVKQMLRRKVIAKWGESHWYAMDQLMIHESHYNLFAINPTSGACGLPQSLPCNKLLKVCGSLANAECQTDWTMNYTSDRYDNPINAWAIYPTTRCARYSGRVCTLWAANWW